jgi:hypothetical protein
MVGQTGDEIFAAALGFLVETDCVVGGMVVAFVGWCFR